METSEQDREAASEIVGRPIRLATLPEPLNALIDRIAQALAAARAQERERAARVMDERAATAMQKARDAAIPMIWKECADEAREAAAAIRAGAPAEPPRDRPDVDCALVGLVLAIEVGAESWREARDKNTDPAKNGFFDGAIHAFNDIARTEIYRRAEAARGPAMERLRRSAPAPSGKEAPNAG